MEEADAHPVQPQPSGAASSEAGQQYCQHLVNSLISPHLDTSKPGLNSSLLRAFEEVLANVEKRVKVIFSICNQAGEATAVEPEKCVDAFQKRLHYTEEYLTACFRSRNVNYLYGKMETEEPTASDPQWRTVYQAMVRIKGQFYEEMDVKNSALLDGLVQQKLVADWEKDSILARATPRAKAEELLRTVTPRLDQTRLQQQFIPLLRVDHEHLAESLSRALEEEEETGGSEVKCCVCQFHEIVEVKRLARQLTQFVSPSLESDLLNPALSNASKMHRLKEEVSPEKVIESLREPYPSLHQQFCSGRVTVLECVCSRLREAPTSDIVDDLRTFSVTDDSDVAPMSDLHSLLGVLELKEAYHMESETPGICLIINNKTFNAENFDDRFGSEVDVRKISEFFTQRHLSVVIYEDLVAEEMKSKLKDIACMDHSKYDYFVCFICTHGDHSGTLFGTDGFEISVRDVVSVFHSDNCMSLAGKPKLFFFQTTHPILLTPKFRGADRISPTGADRISPTGADIFICLLCTRNLVPFRSRSEGSWFITVLIEVLSKYGEECHFLDCMSKVAYLMTSSEDRSGFGSWRHQTPKCVYTFRKHLFLSQNSVRTSPAPEFDESVEYEEW